MIQSFATMPAAVFTGWVYDQTQSCTAALVPFMLLFGLATLVLWRAAPRVTTPMRSPLDTTWAGASKTGFVCPIRLLRLRTNAALVGQEFGGEHGALGSTHLGVV